MLMYSLLPLELNGITCIIDVPIAPKKVCSSEELLPVSIFLIGVTKTDGFVGIDCSMVKSELVSKMILEVWNSFGEISEMYSSY